MHADCRARGGACVCVLVIELLQYMDLPHDRALDVPQRLGGRVEIVADDLDGQISAAAGEERRARQRALAAPGSGERRRLGVV